MPSQSRFMQDRGYKVPRRPLPGTWVNKGTMKGRGANSSGPSVDPSSAVLTSRLPLHREYVGVVLRESSTEEATPEVDRVRAALKGR